LLADKVHNIQTELEDKRNERKRYVKEAMKRDAERQSASKLEEENETTAKKRKEEEECAGGNPSEEQETKEEEATNEEAENIDQGSLPLCKPSQD